MKVSFKGVIILLFLFSTGAAAQNSDSAFMFFGNQFDKQWNPQQLQIIGQANAGSNTANSVMFSDFLFRSGFSPSGQEIFLLTSSSKANLNLNFGLNAEYKLDSNWGVYVKNARQSYLTMGNDLSKMLLFGNARYAGYSVSSSNSAILQYATSTVGVSHNTVNNKKWQLKSSLGISALYNYSSYSADNMSILTAKDGAYIDVSVANGKWTTNKMSDVGYGIDLDLDVCYVPNAKNSFLIKLSDLNVYFTPNNTENSIDSSFRFEGIDYVFDSENSNVRFSADSAFNDIINRSGENKKVVFLPNTISVEWVYELNKSNKLGLYAQTVGFGRFGNYVGASYYTDVKENIRLKNTVGIGDFTGFQWNEAVELRLNSTNIFVSAIGLNSLLVPSDSHSYGIALGATKLF